MFLDHVVVWTIRYETARFIVSDLIYDHHVGNDVDSPLRSNLYLSIQPKQFDITLT